MGKRAFNKGDFRRMALHITFAVLLVVSNLLSVALGAGIALRGRKGDLISTENSGNKKSVEERNRQVMDKIIKDGVDEI